MEDKTFHKDLSHISWNEVYRRQVQRADLVPAWMDALGLSASSRVLEIGAGPGFVSLLLAGRVAPDGIVYAIDRADAALQHLELRQRERGISNIRRLVADAAALDAVAAPANAALVTMVLHHADDPTGILRNLHRLLPRHALAVLAEFHPSGPCEQGPPRAQRLEPRQVRKWSEQAGFHVRDYQRQSPEHYMLTIERS